MGTSAMRVAKMSSDKERAVIESAKALVARWVENRIMPGAQGQALKLAVDALAEPEKPKRGCERCNGQGTMWTTRIYGVENRILCDCVWERLEKLER